MVTRQSQENIFNQMAKTIWDVAWQHKNLPLYPILFGNIEVISGRNAIADLIANAPAIGDNK